MRRCEQRSQPEAQNCWAQNELQTFDTHHKNPALCDRSHNSNHSLQTLEDIQSVSDGGVLVFYFEGHEQSVISMTNACKNDLWGWAAVPEEISGLHKH